MNEKIFDGDFFEKLNTLRLSMNMRLNQGFSGARKSGAKGSSVEFSDFREYRPGDDVRRIDWNAYGRMDRLYIKEYMEEKEGCFHLFIDTSRSMCFGRAAKSTMALRIAGALSYIILNNLDRVYLHSMRADSLSGGSGLAGRNALPRILSGLEALEFGGRTALSGAIRSRDIRGRGMAVIISDFLDQDGIEEGLRYLKYKQQDIILIQILAEEETAIDLEGVVEFQDLETGEKIKITLTNQAVARYLDQLRQVRRQLEGLCRKYRLRFLSVGSNQPLDKVLLEGMRGFFG